MRDFDFDAALRRADSIVFKTFANVKVKFGRFYIDGIYDCPSALSQVASGFVEYAQDELFIQTNDAPNIKKGDEIFIHRKTGSQKFVVVRRDDDGDGVTKLTLTEVAIREQDTDPHLRS